MKKTNFLKFALTLVMAFVMSSAWAQFVSQAVVNQEIDTVTVGSLNPYYVVPDTYFNPSFTAPSSNVVSTFAWTVPGDVTITNQSDVPALNQGNYVELTFTATGTKTLSVQETASGCPGTPVTMDVEVVAAPSVAFTADASGTYIGANLNVCVTEPRLATDVVQVALTGYRRFQLVWDLQIYTLASDLVTPSRYFTLAGVDNGAAPSYAVQKTDTDGSQEVIDAATFNLTLPGLGFTTLNEAASPAVERSTVYIYRIRKVNDRISRKSDYLTNTGGLATGWDWYDIVDETITITVNPAPVTGPIYHINNFWAN